MPYRHRQDRGTHRAIAVVAFAAAYVLNQFQGLPLALLDLVVVVAALDGGCAARPTAARSTRWAAASGGAQAGVRVTWVRISAS